MNHRLRCVRRLALEEYGRLANLVRKTAGHVTYLTQGYGVCTVLRGIEAVVARRMTWTPLCHDTDWFGFRDMHELVRRRILS
jgi:hypothetical protein